jgi:hypothetical protein
VSVAKDFLAAWGALSLVRTAITAVWFALLARARRHALRLAAQDDGEIDLAQELSDENLNGWMAKFNEGGGGR